MGRARTVRPRLDARVPERRVRRPQDRRVGSVRSAERDTRARSLDATARAACRRRHRRHARKQDRAGIQSTLCQFRIRGGRPVPRFAKSGHGHIWPHARSDGSRAARVGVRRGATARYTRTRTVRWCPHLRRHVEHRQLRHRRTASSLGDALGWNACESLPDTRASRHRHRASARRAGVRQLQPRWRDIPLQIATNIRRNYNHHARSMQ